MVGVINFATFTHIRGILSPHSASLHQAAEVFSDLPDDVLLEVFLNLDFSEIIALRQTCWRCYRASKAFAVWLDAFYWITNDADNWRASWIDSLPCRSAEEMERLVIRMVRFERTWNSPRAARIESFPAPAGYTEVFLPGGRWLFRPTADDTGRLLYYDLDAPEIKAQTLFQRQRPVQDVWAMTFSTDLKLGCTEFNLAIEFGPADRGPTSSDAPRDMTIWKVSVNPNGGLSAEILHSFSVFRPGPIQGSLSMVKDSQLRLSFDPENRSVFTYHRWGERDGDLVEHFILLSQAANSANTGVLLLPDGRIFAIFLDRIELYAPAKRAWRDSLIVPEDTPTTAPQWTFRYKPPLRSLQHEVSRLVYNGNRGSAMFSIHNSKSIINVQISLHEGSIPDVWVAPLRQMDSHDYMSVGIGRAIRNTFRKKEAAFITVCQRGTLSSLHSFAGVTAEPLNPGDPCLITESKFFSFLPSHSGEWELDEWSGRIRCDIDAEPTTPYGRRLCSIFYLVH